MDDYESAMEFVWRLFKGVFYFWVGITVLSVIGLAVISLIAIFGM